MTIADLRRRREKRGPESHGEPLPEPSGDDGVPPTPAERVANLVAANRGAGPERDPEGMGAARSWREWP